MCSDIKVIKLDTVYHAGSLNIKEKSNFSYEGDGLSVSIHPEEWRSIARLSGKNHTLKKRGGIFADAHSFNFKQLVKWGLEKELIEECELYRFNFESELGDSCYMDFLSLEEALLEACEDESLVSKHKGYKPTGKMESRLKVKTNHSIYRDHLFGLFVQENHPEIDGVWFDDDLDVSALSAPRGMIFQWKLDGWSIELN